MDRFSDHLVPLLFFFLRLSCILHITFCLPFGALLGRVPWNVLGVLSFPNSAEHRRQCVTISRRVSAPTSPGEPHLTSCESSLCLEGGRRMWDFVQTVLLFPGRFLMLVLVACSDLHTWVETAAWYPSGRREIWWKEKNNSFHGSRSYSDTTSWKASQLSHCFPCVSAAIANLPGVCSVQIQLICLAGGKAVTLPFLSRPAWKPVF